MLVVLHQWVERTNSIRFPAPTNWLRECSRNCNDLRGHILSIRYVQCLGLQLAQSTLNCVLGRCNIASSEDGQEYVPRLSEFLHIISSNTRTRIHCNEQLKRYWMMVAMVHILAARSVPHQQAFDGHEQKSFNKMQRHYTNENKVRNTYLYSVL